MRLEMECAKPRIFSGESVICNYVLLAAEELLDVEVAKFPEFRGFWSENISLRQGPMPLNQGLSSDGLHRGHIGAYLITSIVGRTDSSIEPMKLFVRSAGGHEKSGMTLFSKSPELEIRPLPPLPKRFDPQYFRGAIGRFTAFTDIHQVSFQRNEPITIRISLSGEGNFNELNELYMPLPESVERISHRTITQGNSQYLNKTYEISLTLHTEENISVGPTPFIYFDPVSQKYEEIQLPQIAFRFTPSPISAARWPLSEIELPSLAENWSYHRPLYRSVDLWLSEFFLLGVILVILCFISWEERKKQEEATPAFRRKIKSEIAFHALEIGNVECFLRLADEIAYEVLLRSLKLPPHTPRDWVLRSARNRLDPRFVSHAENLFVSYHRLAYGPVKTIPSHLQNLQLDLNRLISNPPH